MSDAETEATPPGGPLRRDAAEGGMPGAQEDEASAHGGEHGSTIPLEEEQPHPEPGVGESRVQQENAETSLDQPSNG